MLASITPRRCPPLEDEMNARVSTTGSYKQFYLIEALCYLNAYLLVV
jgi:hypothetical protein